MRWPSEGYLGDRAFKDNAFLCQRVHVGRQVGGIPVATQAVGSQGVHGDDQNVWSPRFVLPAAARKQQNRQEEESQATREKNGGSPETGCPTDSGGRAHLRLGTPVGAFSYFFCFARLAIGFECLDEGLTSFGVTRFNFERCAQGGDRLVEFSLIGE